MTKIAARAEFINHMTRVVETHNSVTHLPLVIAGRVVGEAVADFLSVRASLHSFQQGERDARERHGAVYADSLKGLLQQVGDDLQRPDLNVVIGRLSDFDLANKRYGHWTMVRETQVAVATAHPRAGWVDTDDLNDGRNRKGKIIKNDLHYSAEGYKELGKRFAARAIGLIRGDSDKSPAAPKETSP